MLIVTYIFELIFQISNYTKYKKNSQDHSENVIQMCVFECNMFKLHSNKHLNNILKILFNIC